MMHRTGRSYHLPTGGAVYFDTGVIEIATPVIEIEKGCAARAGRSLWESIRFLRDELDAWEQREGQTVHLVRLQHALQRLVRAAASRARHRAHGREARDAADAHLPVPVMLLAANRQSTGVGVRPRGNRIEITADFTPDAALMIAAATFIIGVAREVMTWPSFELDALDAHDFPIVREFKPEPHSSRKGWVARFSSFTENPFVADVERADVDDARRRARCRSAGWRRASRAISGPPSTRLGDARSLRLINVVMDGRTPSLLELDDRPASYDSVGQLCTWANLFPVRALARSRYERVFIRAIAGSSCASATTGTRPWACAAGRTSSSRATATARATSSRSTICCATSTRGTSGRAPRSRMRKTLRRKIGAPRVAMRG